ncbi:MAG: competence/damage-inducible protein A [Candidatus Hodarchaeota archaeon]
MERSMRAEIISIGQEVLTGQILDTNSVHITQFLQRIGIHVGWRAIVGDEPDDIYQALNQALSRADVIITTGGIGPSTDDRTRECVSQALNLPLMFQEELFRQIEAYFASRNREMPVSNKKQAYIPQGAIALENKQGTAPAFIVEHSQAVVISLPGVPREMKYFMEEQVLPYLLSKTAKGFIHRSKTIDVVGIGESKLTTYLDDLISKGQERENPSITLLPSSEKGAITILVDHLGSENEVDRKLTMVIEQINQTVPERYVIGVDTTIEEALTDILEQNKQKVLIVEAEPTQGIITQRLVRIATVDHGFTLGLIFPTTNKILERFNQEKHSYTINNGNEITQMLQETYKVDIVLLLLTEKVDDRGLHQLKLWIRIGHEFYERDLLLGLSPVFRNYLASSTMNILRRRLLGKP